MLAGMRYGPKGPDVRDVLASAEELGVRVESPLRPVDVQRVIAAGRKNILRHFREGKIEVDAVELRTLREAARYFGVEYGGTMEPEDTRRIARVVRDRGRLRWEAAQRTPVFAKTSGVPLRLPSHRVRYAGFHQASSRAAHPLNRRGDVQTQILPSRRRGTGRTTAVDIVMPPGEGVRAPVSGRVVEVRGYRLYGKYGDHRIRIVSSENPRLLVTVLHVGRPAVRVGDRVESGRTKIAGTVRKFPFWSQVDGYSGRPWGHVHVEVRGR